MNNIFDNKIYLITTLWSYPYGGGEEFMYDTMCYAHNLKMKVIWISFTNGINKNYTELKIKRTKYGLIINIPGGFNINVLQEWIKLIKPDIIHHQGHKRYDFFLGAKKFRIPFVSGFHFWNGGIDLSPITYNKNILANKKNHKINPELKLLLNEKHCFLYTASFFTRECFNKIINIDIPDIIFPSSSVERYLIKEKQEQKYVSIINIHKFKGGELFLNLLINCPDISFLCVITENGSDDLDKKIKNIINSRQNSLYLERTDNPIEIYKKTKIMLCPSIVDETFCRVVNESMLNGIPVLTTHAGNIKYLVGGTTPIMSFDNAKEWETHIRILLDNPNIYETYSKLMIEQYKIHSEKIAIQQFIDVMKKALKNSKNNNIGIFCPWCPQGLGIQSRNYYNILKTNFNVFIFSYKSYMNINNNNNKEWQIDNIYYSENNRENVKDIEIINFCEKYNIGKFIIPETCWFRVFEIASLLRNIGVKCYGIPNIEIVRKDELHKHNIFYKLLANNYLCHNIFLKKNFNVKYIGYSINNNNNIKSKIFNNNIIKFLFIGGMNAFSRKNVLDICASFKMAYNLNNNIRLTITIQKINDLEYNLSEKLNEYRNNNYINIIERELSDKEINELYIEHHISIQVSKHEGLGLGFYESISYGTPVITLNTPPHNEIIKDNINGWVIDCYFKEMTDNTNAMYGSAYFNINNLRDKIVEVSNEKVINNIIDSLVIDYNKRLSYEKFTKRLCNILA